MRRQRYSSSAVLIILFFFSFALISGKSAAQIIPNKLNLYGSYNISSMHGDPWVQNNGLITPSLYSNYKKINSFSMGASYSIYPWLAAGVQLNWSGNSDWEHPSSSLYDESTVRHFSAGPVVRFVTPFKHFGVFNRIHLFADLGFHMGTADLELKRKTMDIVSPGQIPQHMLNETNRFFGFRPGVGIGYNISSLWGVFAQYSLTYNTIDGVLFLDDSFRVSQLEFGLYLRLINQKRFF